MVRRSRKRQKRIDPRRVARQVALKRRHYAALKQRHDAEQMRRLGVSLRRRLRSPEISPQLVASSERPEGVTPKILPRLPVLPFADPGIVTTTPIEVFNSLEEAYVATANAQHHELLAELRNSQEDERSSIGLGLAIGLSVVAVFGLGIVLCYVLFRRKDGELGTPVSMPVPMPFPYPVPQLGTYPAVIPTSEEVPVPAATAILQHFKKAAHDDGSES